VRNIGILLFMLISGACANLFADEIVLKNGDRLSGSVVRSDAKTLLIKTQFEGDVIVDWTAIDSITSAQPLHVGLTDGQMVVGPVTTADGAMHISSQTAGVVTASKNSIQIMRSDADQVAHDAEIERLRHPHLADLWTGAVDMGLSLTKGNSSTLTYNLATRAVRVTDVEKITVYTTTVYGRNDNTSPSQTIAHETRGGIRADINFATKLFGFAFTDFDSNELQHLSLQNVIGGGVGYHALKTPNTTFDLFGGASYNQEYFSAYTLPNAAPPPATTSFPAVTVKNAELVAGEEFTTKISGRTTFNENFSLYPGISGPGGYRFTLNSTASTRVKAWLGWQVTFSDNFLSKPPFGLKGNDVLLSTGFRVTFGKGNL
jgi:putative salt-induced outer membrane protein